LLGARKVPHAILGRCIRHPAIAYQASHAIRFASHQEDRWRSTSTKRVTTSGAWLLQQTLGVSYLFIGHDLATVAHISHRIAVMYLGQIVELADSLELCARPLHPYTQALFTAALPSHPDERHEKLTITGEVPSALDPPSGCRFHPRCPYAMPQCAGEAPVHKEVASQHMVACHLY